MSSEKPLQEGRKPKYEFTEGHFYCDGVKVHPTQLTEEEIFKYIPTKFQDGYFQALRRMNPGLYPQGPVSVANKVITKESQ